MLVLNVAATWFMTGLIWLIQLVHYPGFAFVASERFASFHAMHSQRITWVVGPAMLIELMTSIALAWQPTRDGWLLRLGCACAIVTWLVTAFASVPAHGQLAAGFDTVAHGRLLVTNWSRTAAWTVHAITVSLVLVRRLAG